MGRRKLEEGEAGSGHQHDQPNALPFFLGEKSYPSETGRKKSEETLENGGA